MADDFIPHNGRTALCWAGKRGDGSVFERVALHALKGRDRVTFAEQEERLKPTADPAASPKAKAPPRKRVRPKSVAPPTIE